MTNFLTYWIKRGMENDADREAATRAHLKKVVEESDKLRSRWDKPVLPPGYWTSPGAMAVSKGRHSEVAGKSPNPYEVALDDIAVAASRRRRD